MPVVGVLFGVSAADRTEHMTAVRRGLSETGFVEGRNVAIEYRWAEGHNDRFPSLAADLVRRQVTVIAAIGGPNSALAEKAASKTAFRLPVFAPAYP